jgi:integrase
MASVFQRKDSGAWILQWQQDNKPRTLNLTKLFNITSKKDAVTYKKAKESELKFGKRILGNNLVFANYCEEYKDWFVVQYPTSYYRIEQIINQHLMPYFGYRPIDTIKIRDCEQYQVERLKCGIKRATVTKELRTLKAMLNKACEWEYLDFNPIAQLKYPKNLDSKPPKFFTTDELLKIYESSNRAHWWRFLANTGLRRGEALALKRQWIGRDGLKVISNEQSRTKSGQWREVPLFEGAKEALDRFENDGSHLYPRVNPSSFSRAAIKDFNRAGVGGSIHCLRHTFCSHLVMEGTSLRVVQVLAGHSKIEVTEQYAHLAPGFLSENVKLCL